MAISIVLGSQWGDEGKGKLVDSLLHQSNVDIVARCAGGHNAGHTLVIDGVKYSFHLLPSGLIHKTALNVIGNGVVVYIPQLKKELEELNSQGIDHQGRLFVSDRAQVLLQLHKQIDGLEEKELAAAKVGTTGNGIGPSYTSKVARSGIRISKLLDKHEFDKHIRRLAEAQRKRWGDLLEYDVEAEIKAADEYRAFIKPFVTDTVKMIVDAQKQGKQLLIEGANALMLDIDFGTYPFVTSSSTCVGGALTGLGGIKRANIRDVIGVVKSYTTRVGSGPLPTEQLNEIGEKLQDKGAEFGTTTGRRRRCGWMDTVVLKYSHTINDYTALNLTKLDVLDTFPELKIATSYKLKQSSGETIEYDGVAFPADLTEATERGLEVSYVTMKGWERDITAVRKWQDLPQEAMDYVLFIEKEVGAYVRWIGVGPARDATIDRGPQ